jgi:selenocysteine lyase/cysteine desulfurase
VIVSLREGLVRVSPHFYNSEDEIDRLLAALP